MSQARQVRMVEILTWMGGNRLLPKAAKRVGYDIRVSFLTTVAMAYTLMPDVTMTAMINAKRSRSPKVPSIPMSPMTEEDWN